ncbi:hypothetical protein [Alicyclobacillus fodiniaquatilis]|uniref:DUF4367 domain-containing protein n=1 Tax=Alicyclobacillus fodiniaquatilis TaxID=1661150 RepID=A0ABW4JCT5_9BACL
MKDEEMQKDPTQSQETGKLAYFRDAGAFALTDAEIEAALQRLQMTVREESVPLAWTVSDEVHAPFETGGAQVNGELQNSADALQSVASSKTNVVHLNAKRVRAAGAKRIWRFASGVVAAAVLVGLMVTPIGNKVMAGAMQALYFHNIVGVGQDDMNQIEKALSTSGTSRIDLKQYGSMEVSGGSDAEPNLTLAKAQQLMGIPVKALPGYDAKQDSVYYTPGENITFRLHVAAINQLIHRFGGATDFPPAVDSKAIVFHVPARTDEEVDGKDGRWMDLDELQMPSIEVPSGVDLNQIRQALLNLPFLPSDIRQSLSTSADWKDTLYVPVDGKVTNLSVNGYAAILQNNGQGSNPSILWLENGVLYELSGSTKTFPTDAALVAQAKELTK